MINGAYGSRYHGGFNSHKDDTIRDDKFLGTLDRRGNRHELYSSFGLDTYHGHYQYHPYKRSYREYLLDEFKKAKPPRFNGELKKSKYVEAWLLGMNKFFRLKSY